MRTNIFVTALLLNLGFGAVANAAQTPANDDGAGHVIYLDRHHVNCGFSAINSLKLVRPSNWQIAYNYECTNTGEISANYNTTPANSDGGGNAVFLDRHLVDCRGKSMQYVNLYRPTETQIAYQYNCGNKALTNITDHYTNYNHDGGGNTIVLDRHPMVCPAGKVLTYFHLQRVFADSNGIRYHFRCGSAN